MPPRSLYLPKGRKLQLQLMLMATEEDTKLQRVCSPGVQCKETLICHLAVVGISHHSTSMKIHCWNVKGLNSPLKQHEVVSLMKKNKLDVFGLVETKLITSAVSFMHKLRLKNWKFLSNVAAANTARILIF